MSRKIKVLIAFGTRPEAIKMAPVIQSLREDKQFDVHILSTAQHREMLDQVSEIFNLQADFDLDVMRTGQTLEFLTSRILSNASPMLARIKPDIVLVHGDTTTTFSIALASFYSHIPVGHVEAGLRSFDRYSPFPEETNRKMTSVLACMHFAPTQRNFNNLVSEGVDSQSIWVTGNTVIDALNLVIDYNYQFVSSEIAKINFKERRIIGLTCHRRENLGTPMKQIFTAIREVVDNYGDTELVYPLHKNPAVRSVAQRYLANHPRIHLIEPLDYRDFSNFMARCNIMLTDSGGIQEEAPALNVPVLVLRDTTERPEAIEAGCAQLAGTSCSSVMHACSYLLDDEAHYAAMAQATNPYGDGKAADRIREALREAHRHAYRETIRPMSLATSSTSRSSNKA